MDGRGKHGRIQEAGVSEHSDDRARRKTDEEDESDEAQEHDRAEHGQRKTTKKLDLKVPTDAERREHEKHHLPYRNWCKHCIKVRVKEGPYRQQRGEEGAVLELHADYMFMGEESGGEALANLVGRERWTKALLPTVVPRKSSGGWIARRLVA